MEETWERLKLAVPTSIKNSLKLWPAVTAICFMYIPVEMRSPFTGLVAIGWQTYLSWLNQKAAANVQVLEHEAQAAQAQSAHGSGSGSHESHGVMVS